MNNNQNRVIRQINRVATPIKVDQNGNRIEEPVSQPTNTFTNEKMSAINTVNTKTKEHDPSTMIFITVMLIIFASATAYICYVLLPRENDYQTSKYGYNDTNVISDRTTNYKVDNVILNKGLNINGVFEDSVNNFFNIEKKENKDIYVNGEYIATNDILFANFITIDNVLLLGVRDEAVNTTMVYLVNDDGEVINKYYNIAEENGMVLGSNSLTYTTLNDNILLHFSRVSYDKVYTSLEYGATDSINVCDVQDYMNASMDIELQYQGNGNFKETKTNIKTIGTYKNNNFYCR